MFCLHDDGGNAFIDLRFMDRFENVQCYLAIKLFRFIFCYTAKELRRFYGKNLVNPGKKNLQNINVSMCKPLKNKIENNPT